MKRPPFEVVSTVGVLLALCAGGCSSCSGDRVEAERWKFGPTASNPEPDAGVPGDITDEQVWICGSRPGEVSDPPRTVQAGPVQCWGQNTDGQTDAPSGLFVQVAAGWNQSCGIRPSGEIECWGNDSSGQADPPAGEFNHVAAGFDLSCGVRRTSAAECWGRTSAGEVPAPTNYVEVAASGASLGACGVATEGNVNCWGALGDMDRSGSFQHVSLGEGHACGIREDDRIECWGWDSVGQSDAPSGEFVQIDAGDNHTCAVDASGEASCWGGIEESPPVGTYRTLSSGDDYACGVTCRGDIECWGDESNLPSSDPPQGTFLQVSAGSSHACAIERD